MTTERVTPHESPDELFAKLTYIVHQIPINTLIPMGKFGDDPEEFVNKYLEWKNHDPVTRPEIFDPVIDIENYVYPPDRRRDSQHLAILSSSLSSLLNSSYLTQQCRQLLSNRFKEMYIEGIDSFDETPSIENQRQISVNRLLATHTDEPRNPFLYEEAQVIDEANYLILLRRKNAASSFLIEIGIQPLERKPLEEEVILLLWQAEHKQKFGKGLPLL